MVWYELVECHLESGPCHVILNQLISLSRLDGSLTMSPRHCGTCKQQIAHSAGQDLEDLLNLNHPLVSMSVIQSAGELRWTLFPELVVQVIRVLLLRSKVGKLGELTLESPHFDEGSGQI